jgi:hypothetical protein
MGEWMHGDEAAWVDGKTQEKRTVAGKLQGQRVEAGKMERHA